MRGLVVFAILVASFACSADKLQDRIGPPSGYQRVAVISGSFAEWLRNLPLKPGRPPVYLYNGQKKQNQEAHYAVVDLDVGNRDLQQCADAVMRLRAEYLYSTQQYDQIHFRFTSGDNCTFNEWRKGARPIVHGNRVSWVMSAGADSSYPSFRKFLDVVFQYAGTSSLSQELSPISVGRMQIGDVFVQGGFPGHAVLIVDLAENPTTGHKVFLLTQSYMPAQEIHVLRNPNDLNLSPWYNLDFGDTLVTPEWTFSSTHLKRF